MQVISRDYRPVKVRNAVYNFIFEVDMVVTCVHGSVLTSFCGSETLYTCVFDKHPLKDIFDVTFVEFWVQPPP